MGKSTKSQMYVNEQDVCTYTNYHHSSQRRRDRGAVILNGKMEPLMNTNISDYEEVAKDLPFFPQEGCPIVLIDIESGNFIKHSR